jgi:hypothetical protein
VREISLNEAGVWVASLKGKLRQAAQRGLLGAGQKLVSHIQTDIIPNSGPMPVDRGAYKAGWRAEATEYGARVYNSVPYAGAIEDGVAAGHVAPGSAMVSAITAWVLRKGLVGRGSDRISRAAANVQAAQVAWAIIMSMKKRGIFGGEGKGLKILSKATKMLPEFIRTEVRAELAKAKQNL